MKRRVCITGMGMLNASGVGKEDFWNNISKGHNNITKITRFDSANFPINVAGEIRNFVATDFVPRRLAMKMDRFAHFALAATELALQDAKLELAQCDPYQVGVWFGNNSGGWDICERGLFEMYREGPQFVNPWQATAWFPTSPQGYVTIAKGIKGMSKSFICDRASSASALHFGFNAVANGHNDIALVGGTEAPITAFGMTCYFEAGDLASSCDDVTAYKPFDKNRNGLVIGEGSAVLIFEELEHALKRGATIYGEVVASAMFTDANPDTNKHFIKTQQTVLERAGLTANDISLIFSEGCGTRSGDQLEAEAINAVFLHSPEVPVTCPKSGYGHLYGASTATDIACGLLAAQHNLIPPTPNSEQLASDVPINLIQKPISHNINNFLINARAREGTNVSLVVKTSIN